MAASYVRLTEARQKLVECPAFTRLCEARHELTDGVVLTSVSDVPFEMSFRCTRCAEVFWFENLSWCEGGFSRWRLNTEHQECVPSEANWSGPDYALRMHP